MSSPHVFHNFSRYAPAPKLQVRGVSSIYRLSVTQLNSEEPFVASVTLVAGEDAGKAASTSGEKVVEESVGGGLGTSPRQVLAGKTALVGSVKQLLARHNIGRNTVEVIFPHGDAPRGAVGSLEEEVEGESGGGGIAGTDGAFLSEGESTTSAHDEAERGQVGAGGRHESDGKPHGRRSHRAHGHGHCSGHGHSHSHATSIDLV